MGRPLAGGARGRWLAVVCGSLIAVVLVVGPNAALADADDGGGTDIVDVGAAPSSEVDVGENGLPAPETPTPEPQAAEPPPPSTGEVIVAFALQYQGYPYAWAGNTPAGFDCSGFAQFVILNTLGIDIGHALGGQTGAGAWVDWEAWQPGDLVFFQNTYQGGLSHVGIYVGDGLFIHAENEGTGVVISSMYSDYYGPRYYGAVRVA